MTSAAPRTSPISFEVLATAAEDGSRARSGRLQTPHGAIETPVFMPVGTNATVKTLDPDDLRENTGGLPFPEHTTHDVEPVNGEIVEDALIDLGALLCDLGRYAAIEAGGGTAIAAVADVSDSEAVNSIQPHGGRRRLSQTSAR